MGRVSTMASGTSKLCNVKQKKKAEDNKRANAKAKKLLNLPSLFFGKNWPEGGKCLG